MLPSRRRLSLDARRRTAVCRRYRAGLRLRAVVESMSPAWIALAAMHADTPVGPLAAQGPAALGLVGIVPPACRRAGFGSSRTCGRPSGVSPRAAKRSTARSSTAGTGKPCLLAADDHRHPQAGTRTVPDDSPQVRFTIPLAAAKTLDGKDVPVRDGQLDAGPFTAWQVKGFEITPKGKGKP